VLCELLGYRAIGRVFEPWLSVLRYEHKRRIVLGLPCSFDGFCRFLPQWEFAIHRCFWPWVANPSANNVTRFELPNIRWPKPTIQRKQHEAPHLSICFGVERSEFVDGENLRRARLPFLPQRNLAWLGKAHAHAQWPINQLILVGKVEYRSASLDLIR